MNLKPIETTYWFSYFADTGVMHMGVTEPGLVTTSCPTDFQCGPDILDQIEKYKAALPVADDNTPAEVGFCVYNGTVVQVKKEDCCDGKTVKDVVTIKEVAVLPERQ